MAEDGILRLEGHGLERPRTAAVKDQDVLRLQRSWTGAFEDRWGSTSERSTTEAWSGRVLKRSNTGVAEEAASDWSGRGLQRP